jgi:hypothetical protein
MRARSHASVPTRRDRVEHCHDGHDVEVKKEGKRFWQFTNIILFKASPHQLRQLFHLPHVWVACISGGSLIGLALILDFAA